MRDIAQYHADGMPPPFLYFRSSRAMRRHAAAFGILTLHDTIFQQILSRRFLRLISQLLFSARAKGEMLIFQVRACLSRSSLKPFSDASL